MNTNKVTIIGSIIIIILLISIPTIYKVVKNHRENLYLVVEERIIESAKKCYYEDKCKDDIITLAYLYENDYLDTVINPVTKEYYNSSSYVKREGTNFTFITVE